MRIRTLASLAVAGVTFSLAGAPEQAYACSCSSAVVGQITGGATRVAGQVASGATSITMAMTRGFTEVGSTVTGSSAQQTAQVVNALEQLASVVSAEIRKVPVQQEQMQQRLNQYAPARQATAPCTYSDRASDTTAAFKLASLQQKQLGQASGKYNEMTSSYPEGIEPSSRFWAQTNTLMRDRPAVKDAGRILIEKAEGFGALTPAQVQEASTFINLTTNPEPPAKVASPVNSDQLAYNAEVDLYNMRMTLPQAVQNQILSYESPIMSLPEGSWLHDMLSRVSPDVAESFAGGNAVFSYSDLLELAATHRVRDPVWLTALAAKDKDGAIKDLAYIQADSAMLDFEIWKQEKSMALMMAQLQAAALRQEKE